MTSFRRFDPAGLMAGILLLGFAGLIALDTVSLRISPLYGIGPKAMPYVVAGGLVLLGLGNLALAVQGDFPARESLDKGRVFLILGAVTALIGLISFGAGFILAATILFAAVARAFEETPVSTTVHYGLMVTVTLLAATVALTLSGLDLPAAFSGVLVAATLALVAFALVSRSGARNLTVGFTISLTAYLLFAKLLALTLPNGPLERLF